MRESLHQSFGAVDHSHLEGLVFFEGDKPHLHVEKALQAELASADLTPSPAVPHAAAAAPAFEPPTDSSHLEGLAFFEGQNHHLNKKTEIHRLGLDRHLGGAGFDVEEAASTPQPKHQEINK